MKLSAKTALGIDISDGLINLALLRQSIKGIELVRTASGPVPDGAIEDGSIEDPAALAKAIKELRKRNRMWARKSAVSLSVSPVVTRILETPEATPNNMRQFLRDELKSYVALSGREIAYDFCSIRSGHGSGGRLLAVAAGDERVAELIETYARSGLNVEVVEPALLGYIRALYAEKIEGRFDCNVLVALLYGSTLTLCVFQKETLDIVRVEDISAEKAEPDELCRRLAAEINTIIQFYDLEVADSVGKWEVTVFADGVQLPDDAEESLKAETPDAELEVISGENACKDLIVDRNGARHERSTLAIGLAMGLLDVHETGLKVNLVPPESAEVRSVKKQIALTAVVVAMVIPLLAFLSGKGLGLLADKVHRGIDNKEQTEASQDMTALLKEQKVLERQIELLSKRPEGINAIFGSRRTVDWASILDEVKDRTPKEVRITALHNVGEDRMRLEGLALSYEAARFFEKKLTESDYISMASRSGATREESANGLVTYTIDCSLADRESES